METQAIPHQLYFENGWYPSQSPFEGIPNSVLLAQNVWLRGPRRLVSDRGALAVSSVAQAVHDLMSVGGQPGGCTTSGNVTLHASVPWAAGSGNAIQGSTVLGALTGNLMLYIAGAQPPFVNAGLNRPNAPGLTVSSMASSKWSGSYSVAVAAYRSTTGAIGNRSDPSPVVAANGFKGQIMFPAPVAGQTHWLIYGSRRGFGSVGPYFRVTGANFGLTTFPVSQFQQGSTAPIDYFDGELGDLAPTNNDPPPACTHCAGLGSVMCALGTFGGYGITPSQPGFPEAYDLTQTTFLAAREPITGVTGRGIDGVVYVATANSLSAIVLSGSDVTPVLPRGIWESVGFAHGNAFCLVEDQIYGFSGEAVRTQGGEAPDTSFALPVYNYFYSNGWTSANTVVVYDPGLDAVLYCGNDSVLGPVAVPYMRASGTWSGPIVAPGAVSAAVTLNGRAALQIGTQLFNLDSAGGNPTGGWSIQTPYYGGPMGYIHEGYAQHIKTLRYLRANASGPCTIDILKNLGGSVGGKFPYSHPGGIGGQVVKFNQRVHNYAMKVSGGLGGQSFYGAEMEMLVEPGNY
ncbi:MAG TPA: hypothetical protein VN345_04760 [Blastocatellia bacterium]|nr:hypothetical protein [Blastocatellia bacterium]